MCSISHLAPTGSDTNVTYANSRRDERAKRARRGDLPEGRRSERAKRASRDDLPEGLGDERAKRARRDDHPKGAPMCGFHRRPI